MEKFYVDIQSAGEKGRGLFTTTQFSKGDIIFEEDPVISCQFAWNQDYKYLACDHCLRPLETAEENARRLSMLNDLIIPFPEQCFVEKSKHVSCPSCNVTYCSLECQNTAWNRYHKTLCLQKFDRDNTHPLELLKQTWKEMHYPPETSTIMLFARIFAVIHQAEDKEAISNVIEQFCHPSTTEDLSYSLLGLKFSDQLDILREQLLNCVPTEHAEQWITPDGFRKLVSLVGMNGQGIGTSAVSDWLKNVKKLGLKERERESIDKFVEKLYNDFDNAVGDFLNNEGSGLYSMQSCINHSCKPNAEILFPNSNHRLAVRCIENILPGDEITISYVDECVLERSRHTRQKILLNNYFFECKCVKCVTEMDQPDETSEEEMDEDISED